MSSIEFVLGIHLIVIGLAIANVLAFVSDMFKYQDRISLSWLMPAWCAFLLFGSVSLAFALWEVETQRPSKTVFEVLLFFQWTVFLYLTTRILNPELAHRERLDLDDFFLSVRKPFFFCLFMPSILFNIIGIGLLGLPIANIWVSVCAYALIGLGILGFFTATAHAQRGIVVVYFIVQAIQETLQLGLSIDS